MSDQKRDQAAKAQLAWRNRRILATRCGWPHGALETCERTDQLRPGWWSGWLPENTIRDFERPAGFIAWRRGADNAQVFAADAEQLLAAIDAEPQVHQYDLAEGERCYCRACAA